MPQPRAVGYAEPIALDVAALQCLIDFLDDPSEPRWRHRMLLVPSAAEDMYWAACPPGPDPGGFDMRDLFVLPRDWNLAPDYSVPRNGEGLVRRARELAALLDFRTERAVESCEAAQDGVRPGTHAHTAQLTFHELREKQFEEEFFALQARTHAQARTRTKLALLRARRTKQEEPFDLSTGWTPDAWNPLVPGLVQSPFISTRWPDQRLHAHLDSGMQDVELPPDRQEVPASTKKMHFKQSVNLVHVIGNMKVKTI
jgi:hypothetical protein